MSFTRFLFLTETGCRNVTDFIGVVRVERKVGKAVGKRLNGSGRGVEVVGCGPFDAVEVVFQLGAGVGKGVFLLNGEVSSPVGNFNLSGKGVGSNHWEGVLVTEGDHISTELCRSNLLVGAVGNCRSELCRVRRSVGFGLELSVVGDFVVDELNLCLLFSGYVCASRILRSGPFEVLSIDLVDFSGDGFNNTGQANCDV